MSELRSNQRNRLLALLLSVVVYPLCALATAAALFFPVIMLAGPHSDMLPHALQVLVILLGWLTVFGFPGWVSLKVYRRFLGSDRKL